MSSLIVLGILAIGYVVLAVVIVSTERKARRK